MMKAFPIAVVLLAGLLAACQQSSTTPSAVTNTSKLPADQVLFGLRHVMTKDGIRSSVLDGDTALLLEDSQTLELSGVHLTFFDLNGAESGKLTARKGSYDVAGGLFVARDHVVLVTRGADGPRTIETSELSYQVKTDQLWSEKPFTMTEAGRTTHGSSFHTDGKGTSWTVRDAKTSGGLATEGGGGLSF
jgi:LPS export ABC transporter protein LptC